MIRIIAFVISLFCFSSAVYAACTLPGADDGEIEYFTGDHTYKICIGSNWIPFEVSGTLSACANEAKFELDGITGKYKYCNGTDWKSLGCIGPDEFAIVGQGGNHTCALDKKKQAWCWGQNAYGQLGDNTYVAHYSPAPVGTVGTSTFFSDWEKLVVGRYHVCGIRSNKTLWCWGGNSSGSIGNNTLSTGTNIPLEVGTTGTSTRFSDWEKVYIAHNNAQTCGIRSNGTLWCWGANNTNIIGDGTSNNALVPTQVGTSGTSTQFTDWVKVDFMNASMCGLRSNGTAWCWGNNINGQVGDGTNSAALVPTQVGTSGTSTLFTDWTEIVASENTACGMRSGGTAWCWGSGNNGVLGDNTNVAKNIPTQVGTSGTSTLFSDWQKITTKLSAACGIRSNGELWCWGAGSSGRLGYGSSTAMLYPVRVGTSGTSTLFSDWTNVMLTYSVSCGVRNSGELWCWGAGSSGTLGNGTTTASQTTPVRVGTSGTSTLFNDLGWMNSQYDGTLTLCGLRSNGHLYCWGSNNNGQIGTGASGTNQTTPYKVSTSDPVCAGVTSCNGQKLNSMEYISSKLQICDGVNWQIIAQ